jgi:hypothetical protein
MIDITVDNNEIYVENKLYHSFNDKENLVIALVDLIDKVKYSGESISLWKIFKDEKFFVKDWH